MKKELELIIAELRQMAQEGDAEFRYRECLDEDDRLLRTLALALSKERSELADRLAQVVAQDRQNRYTLWDAAIK
jgi:hypothetical protein